MVKASPLIIPCFEKAASAYSEQVGQKRHME